MKQLASVRSTSSADQTSDDALAAGRDSRSASMLAPASPIASGLLQSSAKPIYNPIQAGNPSSLVHGLDHHGRIDPNNSEAGWGLSKKDPQWALVWAEDRIHGAQPDDVGEGIANDHVACALLANSLPPIPTTQVDLGSGLKTTVPDVEATKVVYLPRPVITLENDPGNALAQSIADALDQEGGAGKPGEPTELPEPDIPYL